MADGYFRTLRTILPLSAGGVEWWFSSAGPSPLSKPATAYPPSRNHHTSFSYLLWYMTSHSTNVESLVMCHYSVIVLFSPLTRHTSHPICISSNLFPPRRRNPSVVCHLIPEISVGQSMRPNLLVKPANLSPVPQQIPIRPDNLVFHHFFTIHDPYVIEIIVLFTFLPSTAINLWTL